MTQTRHKASIGTTLTVSVDMQSTVSTRHQTTVGLKLGHGRRLWHNIKPTLVQCVVFVRSAAVTRV